MYHILILLFNKLIRTRVKASILRIWTKKESKTFSLKLDKAKKNQPLIPWETAEIVNLQTHKSSQLITKTLQRSDLLT